MIINIIIWSPYYPYCKNSWHSFTTEIPYFGTSKSESRHVSAKWDHYVAVNYGTAISMQGHVIEDVHGDNMGPIWGRQDPAGPHVGPMNFAIYVSIIEMFFIYIKYYLTVIYLILHYICKLCSRRPNIFSATNTGECELSALTWFRIAQNSLW